MTLINSSILIFFAIFGIMLTILTIYRQNLTYKFISLVLTLFTFFFFFCTLLNWHDFFLNKTKEILMLNIFNFEWTTINFTLNLELSKLSYTFMTLVLGIGVCTNMYILHYFKGEQRCEEFYLLINWFIYSMITLVLANNVFTLLLGWELIGFTSFLLINFWYTKNNTLSSSFKAYSFNKFSDICLIVSFALFWNISKIDELSSFLLICEINGNLYQKTLFWAVSFLILGSSIKSAQIIGHLWLPDSMEAPVPASALIHSATLVSAGIYLILKFFNIIVLLQMQNIIFILGSLTAAYGGLVSATQSDMKKLLAYSTISHCGFIMSSVVFSNFYLTMTYLYLHGIFKAATFFVVGGIIKQTGTQDFRFIGKLKQNLVLKYLLLFCSVNLGGLPFTFGFLYKKLILYFILTNNVFAFGLGFQIIGMLSSLLYTFRLNYYTFFDIQKSNTQKTLLYLQNNKKNSYFKNLTGFSYGLLLALFCVFFFVVYFFIYINAIINVDVTQDLGFIGENNLIYSIKNYYIYNIYFFLFYSLFMFIFTLLILQISAKTFSLTSSLFIYWLFIILLTSIFFFILLKTYIVLYFANLVTLLLIWAFDATTAINELFNYKFVNKTTNYKTQYNFIKFRYIKKNYLNLLKYFV